VQVIAAHDDGALHLGGHNNTLQDATADGHITGERALLVDERALDGLAGGLEAKTDGSVVALATILRSLQRKEALAAGEDTALLLERALDLQPIANKQTSTNKKLKVLQL
jgi:hypothetical protein